MQPDGNHIVARLMEIRDYTQQATAMLEALGSQSDQVQTIDHYATLNASGEVTSQSLWSQCDRVCGYNMI